MTPIHDPVMVQMLHHAVTLVAQATGGQQGGSQGISGSGSAACTQFASSTAVTQASGMLTGVLVFFAGTPFKVAAGVGFIGGIITLLLDNGHLPHMAKIALTVVLALVLVSVFIGWIFAPNTALVTC